MIEEDIRKLPQELQEIKEKLSEPNLVDGLIDALTKRKTEIQNFLNGSPDEVLRSLQAVYDFVRKQEQEGLERENILRNMKSEKPELAQAVTDFYEIARSEPWGYRILQYLHGLKIREQLSKDTGAILP